MKNNDLIISADPAQLPLPEDDEAGGEAEIRPLVFGLADHGKRLDQAILRQVAGFSRSYLQQLVESGMVSLAGRTVIKPAHRVKDGDHGSIELRPTPQSLAYVPQQMMLTVVHEDEHLLVLNKPAGLVVHPAPGNWNGTLLNGLLARDPQVAQLPRAGIVHRLDKDTSGLMVVARSRRCMDALVGMIAAREVERQYLAISGKPWSGPEHRTVEAGIGRDIKNRLRMAVVDLTHLPGKPAKTDFQVLCSTDESCLVLCKLHTGRTHQIRVHMAHIHMPLLGDAVYGGAMTEAMPRQALHATRLAFVHPITGQDIDCHAALPLDMAAALTALGLDQPR
ncbi:MAG: hypothetical protein RLZZ126_664 [Pseudomonadota bacterium]